MKLKKILPIALAFMLSITVAACSKNDNNVDTNEVEDKIVNEVSDKDKEYVKIYNELYKNNIKPLNKYEIYSSNDDSIEYYKNNEYPGNESYLVQLKDAYKDSEILIKEFIDELKDKAEPQNYDLNQMNKSLTSEAELAINNINEKLERIDQIPKELTKKTKEEFIKIVFDTAELKTDTENEFDDMIEYLNKKFNEKND